MSGKRPPPLREDLFWEKVQRFDGSCWIWQGREKQNGYGMFDVAGKPRLPHRVAYELLVGPIPTGLELDHLCRNRGCVNPDHLEPVTHLENVRRGDICTDQNPRSLKTHCPHGHPYAGDNLIVRYGRRGKTACHNAADRKRRARIRAAAQASQTLPMPIPGREA